MFIDFFVHRRKKNKNAWNLLTSAGNKRWMERDDWFVLYVTKAVAPAFRGG